MSEPRILVIGEKFIDRYFVGTATRLSPEAPIPVVAVSEVIQFAGGAANVARNLEALGADTILYTPQDTPVKNRLVANGHQLARWDENDHILPIKLPAIGPGIDAIIISDYGKGGFNPSIISTIIELSQPKTPIFIDCKDPRSYTTLFESRGFFFPNMKEWQSFQSEYSKCGNVIRTESEKGMTYYGWGYLSSKFKDFPKSYHVPSLTDNVVSVTGAGDTAIAAFTYKYCVDKSNNIKQCLEFASKACAVVVSKPYTATASHEEINKIKP